MKMEKLFFVFLIFFTTGIPINTWWGFAPVFFCACIIFFGSVNQDKKNIKFASIIAVGVVIVKVSLPAHTINEGHNIFTPQADTPLALGLPGSVFEDARKIFYKTPNTAPVKPARELWQRSMDAVFFPSELSRWREGLDFASRWELQVGALNDEYHNYIQTPNPTGFKHYLPLIFRFDLPLSSAGGQLCWKGTIYWPDTFEGYKQLHNAEISCRTLGAAAFKDDFLSIYAIDFDPDNQLSMVLETSGFKDKAPLAKNLLSFLGAIAILLLLGRMPRYRALIAIGSLASLAIVLILRQLRHGLPSGFSPMVYMERGNDGMRHYGFGRDIVDNILRLDFETAFMAGEKVFYFMPGLRYINATLFPVFGESILGLFLIVSLLPFLVFKLFQCIIPNNWAFLMTAFFIGVPVLNNLGFFDFYYVRLTARGFGGGLAWTFFMAALVLLWRGTLQNKWQNPWVYFCAGLLLALTVACRPNLAPGVAILVSAYIAWFAFFFEARKDGARNAVFFGAGALLILLVPYHNWHYTNTFVPLTRSADMAVNLYVTPSDYILLLKAIFVSIDGAPETLDKVLNHLSIWMKYNNVEKLIVFANLCFVCLWARTPWHIRVLGLSLFANHMVFLFYQGIERYTYGLWTLTFLIFVWSVANHIGPWLAKRYRALERPGRWLAKTDKLLGTGNQ